MIPPTGSVRMNVLLSVTVLVSAHWVDPTGCLASSRHTLVPSLGCNSETRESLRGNCYGKFNLRAVQNGVRPIIPVSFVLLAKKIRER